MAAVSNPQSLIDRPADLRMSATDPENDTLLWFATGLPAGVSINANTGLITGTPTNVGTSNDHFGLRARFNETLDTDFGLLNFIGALGYHADISKDSEAEAYRLADNTVIYVHDVSRRDAAQSSSHSMIALGANLTTDHGWIFRADSKLRDYKTGSISSLSLAAAYRF